MPQETNEDLTTSSPEDFTITEDGTLTEYRGHAQRVCVPKGVKTIQGTLNGCQEMQVLELPEGLTRIGSPYWQDRFTPTLCNNPSLRVLKLPSTMEDISFGVRLGKSPLEHIELAPGCQEFRVVDGALLDRTGFAFALPAPKGGAEPYIIPEGTTGSSLEFQNRGKKISSLVLPSSFRNVTKGFVDGSLFMLLTVERYEVSPQNPLLISRDGILYTREGELLAYPALKDQALLTLTEETTSVAPYAFSTAPDSLRVVLSPSTGLEWNSFYGFRGVVEAVEDAHVLRLKPEPWDEARARELSRTSPYALVVPATPIGDLPVWLKRHACVGYMLSVHEGRYINPEIAQGYERYIRSQRKRLKLHEELDVHPLIADYLIGETIMTAQEASEAAGALETANPGLADRLRSYAQNPKKNASWRPRTPEPAPTKPVPIEPLVTELLPGVTIPPKVKKDVRTGVTLADGSGVSSPEALQLLLGLCGFDPSEVGASSLKKCQWLNYEFHWSLDRKDAAELVAALFDRKELSRALERLFYSMGLREALPALARFGDQEATKRLIDQLPRWDLGTEGDIGRRNMTVAIAALLYNDTREAMQFADDHKRLSSYAFVRGVDESTLRDRTLSNLGFDESGEQVLAMGGKTITLAIGADLKITYRDTETGRVTKSLPKRGVDAEAYEAAKQKVAALKKRIRDVVKRRKVLLFEQYLSGTRTPVEQWTSVYQENPVLQAVARLVVWDQGGRSFILGPMGPVKADGEAVELGPSDIRVAHPVEMDPQDLASWRRYLVNNGIKQPFRQVWDDPVQKRDIAPDRYANYPVPGYCFRRQEKLGIRFIPSEDFMSAACTVSFYGARASVRQLDYSRGDAANRFLIERFEPASWASSRSISSLASYLDRCTLRGRVAAGDLSVLERLQETSLEVLLNCVDVAAENHQTELAAQLVELRHRRFPEAPEGTSLLL